MGRVERYNSFTIAPKSLGHGQPTLIVHLSGEGFSAGPQLQALDRSGPRWVKVIPAGPQLQALVRCGPHGRKQQHLNQSDPHRTTTASSRSQWSPPDPASNRWLKVIPAGPPLQVLDRSGPRRTRLEPLASRSSLSLFLLALARACPPAPDGGRWKESCQRRRRHWRGRTAAQLRPVLGQPPDLHQSSNSGSERSTPDLATKNFRNFPKIYQIE